MDSQEPYSKVQSSLTEEQIGDIETNRDIAAASYLWILSIVILYKHGHSPFVRHHARQGVWLFVLSIPVWFIPVVGHALEFFVLAGMIIGFLNAAQGAYHDIPLIGSLANGSLTLRDLWRSVADAVLKVGKTLKRSVTAEPGKPHSSRINDSPRPPVS